MKEVLKPKSKIQLRIEFYSTNGRSYQTVPYTSLLGQRNAFKQWLKFSRGRVVSTYRNKDKTELSLYLLRKPIGEIINLVNKVDYKINDFNNRVREIVENAPFLILQHSGVLDRINRLEKSVNNFTQSS